jgi:cytoskeletal protein CcmA (bactofilin family)
LDSTKWAALYLIDEDRPLSLSGKTSIIGNVYIPKAGVTSAYVDNKSYQGDKRLVVGTKKNSEKTLPALSATRLTQFEQFTQQTHSGGNSLARNDSLGRSFLLPTRYISFGKKVQNISNVKLSGNIIVTSDTTVTIDSTVSLKDIMVFARSIKVKAGFHGNCQLFARDSISVDSNCRFTYPSCLGILRFGQLGLTPTQEQLILGNKCTFSGIVFTYEKNESALKPVIDLGKGTKITGEVYSQGILRTKDSVEVNGSVFTSQFLYQNAFTLFKNYLINLTINSKALSPYYLTGDLFPVAGQKKKILQWLEAK